MSGVSQVQILQPFTMLTVILTLLVCKERRKKKKKKNKKKIKIEKKKYVYATERKIES